MDPIVNKIKDGIHRDNTELEQPDDTYRDARNFVIHQVANGMYKAVTLKGTELYFTMTTNEKPMAFTSIRNRNFLIVLNAVDQIVKFYELFEDRLTGVCTLNQLRQISNTFMNLSFDWPIRTIFGFYENDDVQRIYWTDYNNSPIVINVQSMEGSDTKFAKYLPFTPVLENIYGQFVFDSVNAGGNLLNGNYFVAWQYYTKEGYYSDWSPLSLPVSVTPSTPGATIDSYQEFIGGEPNVNSSKNIKFKLRNLDTDYSSIRVAAFYSNDYNSAGPGVIFFDGDVSAAEMTFNFRGSENLGTLTLNELIEQTMVVDKCKSLSPIKLYNVAACIKERDELDFSPSHENNLLPVKVDVQVYELLADTTGYPTNPFAAGSKSLFAVPKCTPIIAGNIGYAGIWYKANEVSTITPFSGVNIVKQQGEYYKDLLGKFTLVSGTMTPIHKINKYDAEGVSLKGIATTIQTAQAAVARVDKILVNGSWGNANITISGMTAAITFSNDLRETIMNFVSTNYDTFLAGGVVLNTSFDDIIGSNVIVATASVPGTDFTGNTTFTPDAGDLDGDIAQTVPFAPATPQVDTIVLTGTGGAADIYVDGIGPCPIVFNHSILQSIGEWISRYRNSFPGIQIGSYTPNPPNEGSLTFTANALNTAFTPATISHNGPGTLTGAISTLQVISSGGKQVGKIRFIGMTSGTVTITVGTTARSMAFNYSLVATIGSFVSTYASVFLSEQSVDIAVGGTDTLLVSAHIAGVSNPTISTTNVNAYPYNVTIDPNYAVNSGPTARRDQVKLSGLGGILRVTYNTTNYDIYWAGSLAGTVQSFINSWFDNFRLIDITLAVNPSDSEAMIFTSAIITNDLLTFTSGQAPEGDMGGSASSVPAYAGSKHKVTITLRGSSGRAAIRANFTLPKSFNFNTSLSQTALDFKNTYAALFLADNVNVTNSGNTIILEAKNAGVDFTPNQPGIGNLTLGLLAGGPRTVTPSTTPKVRIDKISLLGVRGSADVKVNRISRQIVYATSLTDTAAQFVTDNADGYNTYADITLTSDGVDLIFTGNTSGANFTGASSIINNNQEGNIEELPYIGEYMDYKGPTAATRLRGYPTDEYIRLGILFFDLKGKPYFVRWLDNTLGQEHGDVFIPRRQHISGGSNGFLANYAKTTPSTDGDEYAQTNSRNMFLNISGLDITDVKDKISGFMIVRAPIVHRNLAYGNLSFISTDGTDQNDLHINPGYFHLLSDASKYVGAYAFICPEDLFDFKDFIITKGDKLKNIVHLYPERKSFAVSADLTGMGKLENPINNWTNIAVALNLYSKFYLPTADNDAPANGKEQIIHEILYSLKYNVGDGAIGTPAGVIIDPRNVGKLFKDNTRSLIAGGITYTSNAGKMNLVVLEIDETGNNTKGMFNRAAITPDMLICSVYRENNDPYGGYGDASLANTLYMSTGHYQDISPAILADVLKDGRYIFNNIQVFGGDTFVSLFDHKRNLFNEDQGSGEAKFGYSTIFPVESRINIALRSGNHIAKNHSYEPSTSPQGIRRKVGANKLEDYNYNDGYSSDNINALYHALPFGFVNNSKFEARMRYSQPKTPGEKIDKFRIFPPLNKIDLSINFGIINNIRENYGHLLYWQEDEIGYIPINERQLSSSAFGSAVQLGVGGVFERFDEIVTHLGNSHQFGLIDSPVGYHWYDAKRRMYLSLYKDMKLSQDSIISGLNRFFDGIPDMIYHSDANVPDKSMDSLNYDRPGKDYGICGGFDPKNKIVFTTLFKPDDTIETIGISTLNNKFIGFFDYKSRFYFGMKDKLYSFKNDYSELHIHNTGLPLTFHGELKDGYIQFVIKDQSNLDKLFDTFEIIGNRNFFNSVRYENSNQDITEVVVPTDVEKYLYRNKRWYGTVPLIDRLRIMDSYLLVTFRVSESKEVEIYQITFNTRRMI